MNAKLKAEIDKIIPLARLNLERDGQLLPVAFIFAKDYEDGEIIGCPCQNNEEKEASVVALRKRCEELNACAIVLLNEAWEAALPSNEEWDGTPASKMPNRKEVVLLYVEELDGCWRGRADIDRSNKGKPAFGEIEWEPFGERHPNERFQKLLA